MSRLSIILLAVIWLPLLSCNTIHQLLRPDSPSQVLQTAKVTVAIGRGMQGYSKGKRLIAFETLVRNSAHADTSTWIASSLELTGTKERYQYILFKPKLREKAGAFKRDTIHLAPSSTRRYLTIFFSDRNCCS